jgi:hypothetical protein
MRNRSIRGLYVLAASVAVSSVLGLAGATAASAGVHVHPNATTVCDNNEHDSRSPECKNLSSLMLNQDGGAIFIANATQKGVKAPSLFRNRIINLRQASNTRTNEDFNIQLVGFLGQLCGTGGLASLDPTSFACLNYPAGFPVYENNFTPNSVDSGYCIGALSATEGFKARLLRCGTSRTFLVADVAAAITFTRPGGGVTLKYVPLELASDTSATHPLVLTLQPNSKNPTNLLTFQQENFAGGEPIDRQMWTLTEPAGFTINL